MTRKLIAAAGLTLLCAAAPTHAQTPAQAPAPTYAPAPAPFPLRWGGIGGSWLIPTGSGTDIADDGWAISLYGVQFADPLRRIALGGEIGYYDFGPKSTSGLKTEISMFPVDFMLRFFPTPMANRARPYGMGGIGFYSVRYESTLGSSYYDYDFGTQAGGGLMLRTAGQLALDVSGSYHWVFAPGQDPNFWAVRGGLMIPLAR